MIPAATRPRRAPAELLARGMQHASTASYQQHEFGDSCLIVPGALRDRQSTARDPTSGRRVA